MKKYTARLLETSAQLQAWNDFVANNPYCPILQTTEWGFCKLSSGWKPLYIGVFSDNTLIGGIAILKRGVPFLHKSLFYAPRGPVIDWADSSQLTVLMEKIREIAKKHHAIVLKIDPAIDEKNTHVIDLLAHHHFQKINKQIQPRATFFIDLQKSSDELLAHCSSKHRYNIRLAAKKGVVVSDETTNTGVDIFYKIYEETAHRDRFMIHPKSYYQTVYEHLFKKNMLKIFVASYEKEPLAAVFIFCFGRKIWYMYGASSNKQRNKMPNHLLHWKIIEWAQKQGYAIYDLWGIPAHPEKNHPLFGVYRFKKGFGGNKKIFIGMYDVVLQPIWYMILNRAISLYTGARSLIKKGKISDSLKE